MTDVLVIVAFTTVVVAAAAGGAVFRPDAWYRTLRKPSFTPPDAIFPIAWAILYVTIAVSGMVYWHASAPDARALPLAVYAAQLVANALWSYFFFGRKRIDLAFADIVVLLVLIAVTIVLFARVSTAAAALLVPYFTWVCFAAALNGSILLNNDTRSRTA